MNAFESVVASVLQRQGFWVLTNFKVDLTKEEKRKIGRPSSPRWDLDVVAYSGRNNEVRVVECKSYLDSPGVNCEEWEDGAPRSKRSYYKLFFEPALRQVIFERLSRQLVGLGFCAPDPHVILCLAAGKIQSRAGGEARLREIFEQKGWLLIGPADIRKELERLRKLPYEDSVVAIVAKVLLRGVRATGKG
jgi:hypothetical protein